MSTILHSLMPLHTLSGHSREVLGLAFHPNGKILVSSDTSSEVYFWDIETGKLLQSRKESNGRIRTLAFSLNGKYFALGNDDGMVKKYNWE